MLKILGLLAVGIISQYLMIDDYIDKAKENKDLIINAWLLPCLAWIMIYIVLYILAKEM